MLSFRNGRRFVSSSVGRFTISPANLSLLLNVDWGSDQGLKRPERKANNSTQSRTKADNECSYTYTPPYNSMACTLPKLMPPIYFHGNYTRYKEHNNTI